MAGDYIPVTKTLPRKREVLAIATATGRSRSDVVLALLDFWFWVDDESVDGQLPGLTPSHLTGLFPGTDDAFWLAVISAGWLIQRTTGLEVPNFQRWLGQSAKRRLIEAEKKRQQRSKGKCPGNVPEMSPKMSPKKRDKNGTREEKRREEDKNKSPPTPLLEIPLLLNTEVFRSAWSDWLCYRRQMRIKAYTPQGEKAQLGRLLEWGEARAVAAIRYSMAQGYQGIHEEERSNGNGSRPNVGRLSRVESPPGKYSKLGQTIRVVPFTAESRPGDPLASPQGASDCPDRADAPQNDPQAGCG